MKNVSSDKNYRVFSISKSFNIPEKELLALVENGILQSAGGIGQYKYITGNSLAAYLKRRDESPPMTATETKPEPKFDFFENYKSNGRIIIKNIVKRCERSRRNGICKD